MAMTTQDFVSRAKQEIQECNTAQASDRIENGALVLDVREPQEYMTGHIPGAIELPRGVIEFKADAHPELQDKTREVLVYCQAGGRGALATHTLQLMGFTNVTNILGGFASWTEGGHKIEKAPSEWD